jgi:hypothetical protein
MEFRDLHKFRKGHPPSPDGSPLLVVRVGDGVLPPGLELRAVGWLERPGFPTGAIPGECIEALVKATPGSLFNDGCRGFHACTLCGSSSARVKWKRRTVEVTGHGHYLVQHGPRVYMAPALLLHYIRAHQYLPPEAFLTAVRDGRFLTVDDLVVTWRS